MWSAIRLLRYFFHSGSRIIYEVADVADVADMVSRPDLAERNKWMLWEWRRVSIPDWRRILQESVAMHDSKRETYARWMLRDILLDPEYEEPERKTE